MRFDGILVAAMVLETWVLMPILQTSRSAVSIPVGPLRLLRLMKLTRMARMMQAFPELLVLIKGLCRSIRAISSAFLLIVIMLYSWAILMHMLLKDKRDLN